ncbi:MAG: S9 family peptidase [Planctomycetaceae bacterium]|nr:S9 family peptidase [Planctomycetaceae bacterium]
MVRILAVACVLAAAAIRVVAAENPDAPPMTRTVDHVDDYHGEKVADPYRWLEDDVRTSTDVADWVTRENEHTTRFLEGIPQREAIKTRLTKLYDFERFSAPSKAGGRYYFFKNDGLQNQAVLYVQDSLADEPRVLIDPNKWSADGTIALADVTFSDDGRFLAYGVQDGGTDWHTFRVMEITTGKLLDDELKWIKFNSPAWTMDGEGFFYARFPQPEEGADFQSLNLNAKVYYHRVGRPQSEDVLVFARPDQPEWGYGCSVTEDGRYLVITIHLGTDDKFRIYVKDLSEPYGMPYPLVDTFDHEFSLIGSNGPLLYFKTDIDAPNKRVVAVDLREAAAAGKPAPPVREVIPMQDDAMVSVSLVGDQFLVQTLHDASTRVQCYTLDGKPVRSIELPGIGDADGFTGKQTDGETFYSFTSFTTPPSTYRYDLITGESTLLRRAQVDFDPDQFEVHQEFCNSRDGTRVPVFLAHKKGLKLDGSNPTLLYGYGGFNIPLTPAFSTSRVLWMEMGGVLAVANLRGGGEYGEEWHRAGTKERKQNVFDDFIAVAEWLVDHKYTSSRKLAIQGGSNGGLLVGACMTQRPELFGACLPAVGVMDMLRFHKFTAGRYWTDDYGSSDDPEGFKYLRAYSPYHNIKEGVCYPPTMVTTADTDDRVVPGHSFKFAAQLQAAQSCDNPILIRIETRAGHGSGKPTEKVIEELSDQWAFLVKVFGMQPEMQ